MYVCMYVSIYLSSSIYVSVPSSWHQIPKTLVTAYEMRVVEASDARFLNHLEFPGYWEYLLF